MTTPLSRSAFADLLKTADIEFNVEQNMQAALTGGGTRQRAQRAPSLRTLKITTAPMPNAEAEGLLAILLGLDGVDPFLAYNKRMPYPSSDPDGSIWTTASPTAVVGTITDRRHVAFTGFPNGYVIPVGTYFQIIFDEGRYYLGQFAEAKTADGSGAVSSAKITPPIPASVEVGDAVTVIKPAAKFLPVPGSAYLSNVGLVNATLTFSAEQSYEA